MVWVDWAERKPLCHLDRLETVYSDLLSCGGDAIRGFWWAGRWLNMKPYPKIADPIVEELQNDFNISGDRNDD